ncbi:hypothetical protein DSM117340_02208 [Lentibacter algarum]
MRFNHCNVIYDVSHPKFPLQPQKSALRIFLGKYLCFWGGLLRTPLPQPGAEYD